ncbi:MAG: hypothetical protein Crog4KO_06390 [Crocinitomicaceae bacterium]
MQFSKDTLKNSIQSTCGEYAWRKNDVRMAINDLVENDCAILGGDVWFLKKVHESSEAPMTQIPQEEIAIGIIKCKDGTTTVFNWYSNKRQKENWNEYVRRSTTETENAIKRMRTESHVKDEDRDKVYYNLVYCNEREHEELLKNNIQITAPTPQRSILNWFKTLFNLNNLT